VLRPARPHRTRTATLGATTGTPGIGGWNVERLVCVPSVRIVGPGRAGSSLAGALASLGWHIATPVRRDGDHARAARDVDLCIVSVPDGVIVEVAAAIDPVPTTLVAHLAGSLPAAVLAPHPRRAALHPLASLPDPRRGCDVLLGGVWWAVDGDPGAALVVDALGGRVLPVPPAARPAYHAAACIAANHLVALLAQVERVAASAGLPSEPFYDLAAAALANARSLGASAAITGPAARGDALTLERHLDALDPAEHDLYRALAGAAATLAGRAGLGVEPSLAPNRHRIGANEPVPNKSVPNEPAQVSACR
jgi:predicted short-subunit dehydrogenase-like oxidoreductase (DUF2520 family)